MNFFQKLSNGWDISLNSFKVLLENKQLIIFPILSGISMLALTLSFIVAILAAAGWDADMISEQSTPGRYAGLFLFYMLNYLIVVFFNTALIHCSTLYFRGERPTVRAGLAFSVSRLELILIWSLFAATIGFLLRILQENLGSVGRLITGLIGIVWNIATFFAVPVMIYEQTGPIETVKRSAGIMKEKWGERIGAAFSFGIIYILALFLGGGILFALGLIIHPVVGIVLAVIGALAVIAVLSATQTIFVS
ncbi:MAG: hypothetical protein H0X41_10665, partial [Chitinophagaceae bacterium]|nr:hypothetical protein [Chitinophagaceae bacterium]